MNLVGDAFSPPDIAPVAPIARHSRRPARAALALALVLSFILGATATVDMDFYWHLAQGEGLVQNARFPAVDALTHLPVGHPPDRQAWLTDVCFALLFRLGGITAIRLAAGALLAAGAATLLGWAMRRTSQTAAAVLVVAVYLALGEARFRLRPDLITLALVPILLVRLEAAARRGGLGPLVSLFALTAAWVNFHPGSLMAAFIAVALIFGAWPARRAAAAAAVIGGLCCSPDGPRGLLGYTADTTPLRALIPEWQRLWERPFAEFQFEWAVVVVAVAVATLGLVAMARHRAPEEPRLSVIGDGLLSIVALGLAGTAVRFLFLLAIPLAMGLRRLPSIRPWVLGVGAALIFVAFPLPRLVTIGRNVGAVGPVLLTSADVPPYPVAAARFLAASSFEGNLGQPPKWGGYLAWKLGPRFRTATDGRVTFFGAALADEWLHGVQGPAREEIFTRRDVEILVMPPDFLPRAEWDQRWIPVFADETAMVFVRQDGPHAERNLAALGRRKK